MSYNPDNTPILEKSNVKILENNGLFYWKRYVNNHSVDESGEPFSSRNQAEEDAINMISDSVVDAVGIEYDEWDQASLDQKLKFIQEVFPW